MITGGGDSGKFQQPPAGFYDHRGLTDGFPISRTNESIGDDGNGVVPSLFPFGDSLPIAITKVAPEIRLGPIKERAEETQLLSGHSGVLRDDAEGQHAPKVLFLAHRDGGSVFAKCLRVEAIREPNVVQA